MRRSIYSGGVIYKELILVLGCYPSGRSESAGHKMIHFLSKRLEVPSENSRLIGIKSLLRMGIIFFRD